MKKKDILKKHSILNEYYHITPAGDKCKVYICNCIGDKCKNTIKIWSNASRHDGLCNSCADLNNRKRPYEYLYFVFLNSQKHRKMEALLTFDEFVELCKQDSCHYCGKPTIRDKHRAKKQSNAYMIDRKDNSLPYTKDNCVSCCWYCNDLKGNRFSYEQFLQLRQFMLKKLEI